MTNENATLDQMTKGTKISVVSGKLPICCMSGRCPALKTTGAECAACVKHHTWTATVTGVRNLKAGPSIRLTDCDAIAFSWCHVESGDMVVTVLS